MFIHLHNHSHYSLLDGLPKIDDYINKALEYKMPALGLTDHGVMYGVIEFYQKCKDAGIKPVIGCEIYVAPRELIRRHHKVDDKNYHLILFAKNEIGYKNLMFLTTVAHLDGFYYRPRIDKNILKQKSAGLIATSGCAKGEIPMALKNNQWDKALELVKEYQDIFSKENFYLELEYIGNVQEQIELNEQIKKLAKKTKIPLIIGRDTHYINENDKTAQDVLVCVQTGKVLSDKKRLNMTGFDVSFLHPKLMEEQFKDVPDAIKNTEKIAAECNLNLDLGQWHFPKFELPKNITPEQYLIQIANQGLSKKIPNYDHQTKERLDYELEVINKKGYAPYFLIVSDLIKWSKNQGIITTTRGSCAGSLAGYLTDIVTLNPLDYGLPFERFLNPFRPLPPDIDMDFADNRRDEVIEYVRQKYGYDRVANIATFGTMMARGAVRDVVRVLDLPYSFGDKLAKMIPFGSQGFPMTIDKALEQSSELRNLYQTDPQTKEVLDLSRKVEGCARHVSVHAAGVVIAPTILTDFSPLQKEPQGGGNNIITQYDMHSCEAAGLIKFDFLGIRNLSILGNAVKIIDKTKNIKIDIEKIHLDDQQTFKFISQGNTFGMFQLGGSGMTKWLKELKPTNVKEIMAMIALFRPGPMESIPEYIARKQGKKPIQYLDPKLEPILKDTYGVITYQDDLLLIAINVAGYNWETVDKFRKAVGKKIPKLMAEQEKIFINGCQTYSGWSREKAEELWQLFDPFKGYGFNKCLTGDTKIIDTNNGKIKTIKEIYDSQFKCHPELVSGSPGFTKGSRNNPVLATSPGFGMTKKTDLINVLSLNLENYRLEHKKINKIYKNGKKNVWEIKTKTGKKIKATENHRFLKLRKASTCHSRESGNPETPRVWNFCILDQIGNDSTKGNIKNKKLDILSSPSLRDPSVSPTSSDFPQDDKSEWTKLCNLKIGDQLTIVKKINLKNPINSKIYIDQIIEIKKIGIEETYDLTISDNHNFVANDFIVHNSHAASYGLVAYQTAYLKSHFPAEFMTAVMTAESQNTDKVVEAVRECERLGIKVLPPDVNYSRPDFTYISDKEIRFGLLAIKNLGNDIANIIIANRKEKGVFKFLEDFLTRIESRNLNKKSLEALIKSGAMDSLRERNQMLENIDRLLAFIKYKQKEKNSAQTSLFSSLDNYQQKNELNLRETPSANIKTKLAWEKELLGLYVSGHPFSQMNKLISPHITCPCAEISNLKNSRIKIAGVITNIHKILTKKNELMMFVTIEDITSSTEVVVFPNVLKNSSQVLIEDKNIFVLGRVSVRDEQTAKVLVDSVYEIREDNVEEVVRKINGETMRLNSRFNNFSNQVSADGEIKKYKNLSSTMIEDKEIKRKNINKITKYQDNKKIPESIITRNTVEVSKIWIQLPRFFNSDIHQRLKNIFDQFKGDSQVYLTIFQSGNLRKIETDFRIKFDEIMKIKIEEVVGEGNVRIE